METMFQYIQETPEQCRCNIHHSKELTKEVAVMFKSEESLGDMTKKLLKGESIQDRAEWQRFLLMMENRLDTMIADEARNA